MRFFLFACIILPFIAEGQSKITYENGVFRLTTEPPIIAAAGASKPAGWSYFWEFGDGYYCYVPYGARDKGVAHLFKDPGMYTVRVYLTPLYSHQFHPLPIEQQVTVNTGSGLYPERCAITKVLEKENLVGITTNANGELIPGAEIQVAVHFKAPANATGPVDGQLVLGFNDPDELKRYGLKFSPLLFSKTHPANKRDRLHKAEWVENGQAPAAHIQHLGRGNHLVLKYNGLQPNEERWVFLTFQANRTLDSTLIKKSKRALQTTLSAVWLPNSGTIKSNTCKYIFTLLPVHDPNRIAATPAITYYKRRDPSILEYMVQFQNEEPGAAKEIDIQLPAHPTIDPGSIQIINNKPSCPVCPETFNPKLDSQSCVQVSRSKASDKNFLHLHFYNIFLPGDGPERLSKGWVRFSARTTDERASFTPMRAAIEFDRSNPVITNRVKTPWRYRTFGAKAGYVPWASFKNHQYTPDGLADRLSLGLWWQDAPLKTGYGYGFNVSYTPFRFIRRTTDAAVIFLDGVPGGGSLDEYNFNMRCLDLSANARYHFGGLAAAGLSAGISLPVWAKSGLDARYYTDGYLLSNTGNTFSSLKLEFTDEMLFEFLEEYPPSFSGDQRSQFGLFQKKENTAFFDFFEMPSRRSVGFIGSVFIEFGLMGDLSLGYRQDFRFYPKFYLEKNVTVLNGELFVHVKFGASKP